MGDDGFHITQIRGDGHQLRTVDDGECIAAAVRLVGTHHIKRQDGATFARLLRHGQCVLLV